MVEADDPLPLLTTLAELNIRFYPADLSVLVAMIVLVLLLGISALVSGSEVAYFSLSPGEAASIRQGSTRPHRTAVKLLELPERLLATILVTNNFVNVGIVIIAAFISNSLVEFVNAPLAEFFFQVILITFLLLLFGEILPKIYANVNAVRFSLLMAVPLNILEKIFRPFSQLLIVSTSFVNKRFAHLRPNISMDDLSDALNLPTTELNEDEKILQGIVKFGNIDVSEIMTARVDVVAVDITVSLKKLLQYIIDSGYSRIPVYEDSFDNVKGILYIKDLLPYINHPDDYRWQTLIRPPYFVPETKKINDLLAEFQSKKIHMAIVIDEYGGTQGIVSLEDILEEIVGEISDEFDEDETTFTRIDDRNYLFEGKTQLNDFYKITGVPSEVFDQVKGEADTLAGLILEVQGEIPGKNEVITIKDFVFRIESVDKRRIKKIKVTLDVPRGEQEN